ncbi:MAG: hypothetical protein K8R59_12455 [Thermoanaerobaculales bacterium]|nr:hypothetical protein [Thermoanaerobaculales bacterium]
MTTHTSAPRSRVILACVAAGIFLTGPGLAVSDESPSETRAFDDGGVLMIPASAFSVSGFDPDGHEFWAASGYYRGTATTTGCIKAAVYLPQYARVTSVSATVYDNADPHDILIHLNRVDKDTGTKVTMAELETTAQSGSLLFPSDTSIVVPVILFPQYIYYVGTCLNSSSLRLYGVRIDYETGLFADGFESGSTSAWSAVN